MTTFLVVPSDIQGLTLNHNSSIVQGTDSVKLIFNVGEEVDLDPYLIMEINHISDCLEYGFCWYRNN